MAWWEDYFGEIYLRLFNAMQAPESTAEQVAGALALLDLRPNTHVLDLGCGQGRHAVALARLGFRVTGLDRSPYLLAQAQAAAREFGVEVQWVRGDMRSLPLGQAFGACLSLLTTFGFFENEAENQQVLGEVQRVLEPGGQFLIDTANRDHYLRHQQPRTWWRQDEAIILEENRFDALTCRFLTTFTWLEGDRRESVSHSVRHYTAPELSAMVHKAGLTPTAVWGAMDGSAFDLESRRLIVSARKA